MQAVFALTAVSSLLTSWNQAIAAHGNRGEEPPQPQQQQRQQPPQQQQRQEQARAQQDAGRAQQEQQRKALEQQMQQQAESRRSQEQTMRTQEENARRSQETAMRAQQEAAQRQQRTQQEQSQQQQQQRQQQEAQLQRTQEGQRQQQALQVRAAQSQQREQQKEQAQNVQGEMRAEQNREREGQRTAFGAGPGPGGERSGPGGFRPGIENRPVAPRPLRGTAIQLDKAHSMPVLEPNVSAQEKEHATIVDQNLRAHLYAVEHSQAPQNIGEVQNYWNSNYINNYPVMINNQTAYLNRENCFVHAVEPGQWPYWYNPQPGWQYANGFSLSNMINVAANWLGFGWHPYYGPQPDGFVCATDYFPTLWTYVPAYGLWRVAGEPGWASEGPPYDYTGPISVQVWEPRHIHVRDPYTGWMTDRVINVMYMYNAYFFPEDERWGYTNNNGYFVWLNL